MGLVKRKVSRFVGERINSDGYHKLHIYRTPLGVFWILRWGYWMAGFIQLFSMGKFYIRFYKQI